MSLPRDAWSAIVLTGGTGARLGGADKAALDLGGRPLLDHVIDGLPPRTPIVVAGPFRPTDRAVTFSREDPPGGGPAAGIAAAVPHISTPLVGVLAVDVPSGPSFMTHALASLASDSSIDVVIPVDSEGRGQLLCTAWRTDSLRAAVEAVTDWQGRPVRDLLTGRQVLELPMDDAALDDIDTPEDLERARQRWSSP